ncbi:MAG: molybdopterin-synthase adenylyltransferase MoeB [Aestuariivita sp.]|nr:molybdopterin-synthase adenylyltransferase MoeB [Aestuariivita sp.]
MILVVSLAACLWGIASLLNMPHSIRVAILFIIYFAVLGLHFVLPNGHMLRENTGHSIKPWLLLGTVVSLVFLYITGLRQLRHRARITVSENVQKETEKVSFSTAELNRYSRHIILREIGGAGQKKLHEGSALVIGAGGLGSSVLAYLAAAGLGRIGIIDDDDVEISNLQRQIIHSEEDIGKPKVFSAANTLRSLNSFIKVLPYNCRLDERVARQLIDEYDVIVDGSDNFETRYLVNRLSVFNKKPLVSGALTQWEGQLSIYDPANGDPCYQCIFPHAPANHLAPACAEAGVLGALPGVIGSMMAVETIKIIVGAGKKLSGELLIYDALWGETRKIKIERRPDCPICGITDSITTIP